MRSDPALRIDLPADVLDEIARRVVPLVVAELRSSDGAGSPYLSVNEAAKYARCSRQRIYDLRSRGVLSRCGDGSRALIRRDELDAYLLGRAAMRPAA